MKKLFFFYILLIPSIALSQKDSTQRFEPSQVKADIDTLINKLIEVHPTFLEYYQTNNIASEIEAIKSNIAGPMSGLDFFRLMQPIVTIDGHTSLRYTGPLYADEENPLFPFRVVVFNGSLYIKENLSTNEELTKGSIIESINGVASAEIIDKLINYTPGEKETYKIKKFEKDFHAYMALAYGSFAEFECMVDNIEYKLKGTNWAAFKQPSKPKFELRFYDDDIAYLYKRMFMPPRDFMHFMDSAFTVIAEREIKYLIIDNYKGGGLTDLADSLMSYFTDKPYNMLEKNMTKISPSTNEYIAAKETSGYVEDGYFIEDYSTHVSTRENRFTGTTYILNGPLSYSTATSFPAAAKCYATALLVGEETGQPLASNGGQDQFILPETKTYCITSLSKVYMPCHNNNDVNGVVADYPITPTLNDLLMDRDYTLDYALQLIRENKEKQ